MEKFLFILSILTITIIDNHTVVAQATGNLNVTVRTTNNSTDANSTVRRYTSGWSQQQIDKRSRVPFQNNDYEPYELNQFGKSRHGLEKDIRRKLLSDIVLDEGDPFLESPQDPSETRKRLDLISDRTKKEKGINLLKELNERGIKSAVAESINTAWVKNYASGLAPGYDAASDIVIDYDGNVYVTGTSTKLPYGTDFYTVKYNAGGNLVWSVRYGRDKYIENTATAISVDGSGNVYVTGVSSGSDTSLDYATIKYNSNGVEQWVQRYNGPGNSDDRATAMSVDDAGNVCVTGRSYGSDTYYDYATIKYNSNGVEQWIQRYNGPWLDGYEEATSISLDGSGNVYVTGRSYGLFTDYDYVTIKYNSNGVEQWVQRYNGPGNHDDLAKSISVDSSGNVYVTGRSCGSIYVSIWSIYTTIKYTQQPVSVKDVNYDLPVTYNLFQNYPNPFNPITTIKYSIPSIQIVTLKVYDILGSEVAMLVNEEKLPGYYEVKFVGNNLSSGVYFYRLQAGSFSQTKKFVLLK
jgi:hypothetical protein